MQRLKRTKMIRIDADVYEMLVKLRGAIMAEEGRPVSFSDALRRLLEKA